MSLEAPSTLSNVRVATRHPGGERTGVRRRFGVLEWPALLRKLDKLD